MHKYVTVQYLLSNGERFVNSYEELVLIACTKKFKLSIYYDYVVNYCINFVRIIDKIGDLLILIILFIN